MDAHANPQAVLVMGLPLDLGGNPGASLGCHRLLTAFRVMFASLGTTQAPDRWRPWAEHARVQALPYRLDHTYATWAAETGAAAVRALRAKEFPVLLGGNHLAVGAAYASLAEEIDDLYIVSLDAHYDIGDGTPAQELSHANFWSHVIPKPLLGRVRWIGPRRKPPADELHLSAVQASEWRSLGAETIVDSLGLSGKQVVLDIDLDVLDASVFPAAVSRTPAGPDVLELLALVSVIARRCQVRAVGVTEYNGLLDDALCTCEAVARAVTLHALDAILPAKPRADDGPTRS